MMKGMVYQGDLFLVTSHWSLLHHMAMPTSKGAAEYNHSTRQPYTELRKC